MAKKLNKFSQISIKTANTRKCVGTKIKKTKKNLKFLKFFLKNC